MAVRGAAEDDKLIGRKKGGFVIESLLAEGPFSRVYKAARRSDNALKAIKVAKQIEQSGSLYDACTFVTAGSIFVTGGVRGVHPDPYQLLTHQHAKLKCAGDPVLVRLESDLAEDGGLYFEMEFIEGKTLAEVAAAGPVPLVLFAELARSMQRLCAHAGFTFHGDMKPANIMVADDGRARLIDPGYFGPLDCREGNFADCAVTTAAYYPELLPDDLLAFGIMLWEIATGHHPLDGVCTLAHAEKRNADESLIAMVRAAQAVGLYNLAPLLDLPSPRASRPDMSPACENVLLKAMRLRKLAGGKLGLDSGYTSFDELAAALTGLMESGQKTL